MDVFAEGLQIRVLHALLGPPTAARPWSTDVQFGVAMAASFDQSLGHVKIGRPATQGLTVIVFVQIPQAVLLVMNP